MHQSYPDFLPFVSIQAFYAQFDCPNMSSMIRRGVLFKFATDEDEKAQINLLEKAFRGPITTAINRELNFLRKNSVKQRELLKSLGQIYFQHCDHFPVLVTQYPCCFPVPCARPERPAERG